MAIYIVGVVLAILASLIILGSEIGENPTDRIDQSAPRATYSGGIVPAWIRKQIERRSRTMAHTATMTHSTGRSAAQAEEIISRITALGHRVLRYGLALVIGWIGMMKFTGYEAQGIEPLVAHSPLLGWMYRTWTVRQFAAGLGVIEISIAILIALRPWSRKASAIGSAVAVLMFLTTLSFLFSTPGWEPSLGGFPALSGAVGQFLLKDVVLLGAAIWSLGEALTS
jgi:uncharacterized membrane protein YkgB